MLVILLSGKQNSMLLESIIIPRNTMRVQINTAFFKAKGIPKNIYKFI